MLHLKSTALIAAAALVLCFSGCNKDNNVPNSPVDNASIASTSLDQLDRAAFNKAALRLNLPLFWMFEKTPSKTVRPELLTTLNFYPTSKTFVWKDENGQFTPEFYEVYQRMVDVMKDPLAGKTFDNADESARRLKVAEELDSAFTTVVYSDLTLLSDSEQAFVKAMLKAGEGIDAIYAKQTGLDTVMSRIPADDVMSQSMARRNWGVVANSPKMKDDAACRAILDKADIPVAVYPASLQSDPDFCSKISSRADAESLLTPFTVVTGDGDDLKAVPYSEYFAAEMKAVSDALKEAAAAVADDASEKALHDYLVAASESFLTNNWEPADEAWAAMNSLNSKWYVRCAPDEVYWEPCSRKAGFHLTFARINPAALSWQDKLNPIQQDMENELAKIAGAPYKARTVSFHLPDFIDIVTNSGDDRDSFGATIGQSLPNWGPVANEGRGRTVAMSNLYTDPDSLNSRMNNASAMFVASDVPLLDAGADPGLLSTILHEASHNLGPAHEYAVNGKVDDDIFGGSLATLAEELKAQTCALWFLPFLLDKGVISKELSDQSYADGILWAFGHISRGMEDGSGHIQPYSQLAAIQIGIMLEDGALIYDSDAMAGNGVDKGAFKMNLDKMPAAVDRLMNIVAKLKSTGDKAALEDIQKRYVYGDIIPFDVIKERMLRQPKTSFVYSVKIR